MKKTVLTILSLALAVCLLAGCSNGVTSSVVSHLPSGTEPGKTEAQPYKIGLIQYMEHPSLDTIREAFMSRLEEWGYDETKVVIDYQNAGGENANVNTCLLYTSRCV